MSNVPDIVTSIVIYNTPEKRLKETISSYQNSSKKGPLYIVDNNTGRNEFPSFLNKLEACHVLKPKQNLGYGGGHNLALTNAPKSRYCLILNPDVNIESCCIEKLIHYMDKNPDIGLICPKILNPDGSIQYNCRRNPTFFVLFIRRFLPKFLLRTKLMQKYTSHYEMRDLDEKIAFDIPFISGCFMLFRREIFDQIHGFDENFFLYFEDADITQRANKISKSCYYPEAVAIHDWERANHSSFKLTWTMTISALRYFKKWGFRLFKMT